MSFKYNDVLIELAAVKALKKDGIPNPKTPEEIEHNRRVKDGAELVEMHRQRNERSPIDITYFPKLDTKIPEEKQTKDGCLEYIGYGCGFLVLCPFAVVAALFMLIWAMLNAL